MSIVSTIKGFAGIKQDPTPLIEGLLEGADQLTDLVAGLFGFFILIGFLGLVYGIMKWRQD